MPSIASLPELATVDEAAAGGNAAAEVQTVEKA